MVTFVLTVLLGLAVFVSLIKIVSSAIQNQSWKEASFKLAWLTLVVLLALGVVAFFRVQFLLIE